MKILVVCQYYYPEPFRISDICEELVKLGNEVTVVTVFSLITVILCGIAWLGLYFG